MVDDEATLSQTDLVEEIEARFDDPTKLNWVRPAVPQSSHSSATATVHIAGSCKFSVQGSGA